MGSSGRKNVHSTFSNYADASEGRILFCPIQMGVKDASKSIVPPSSKYNSSNVESQEAWRNYYVAKVDGMDQNLGLWEAYWVSKVKDAIANVRSDYTKPITKVRGTGSHTWACSLLYTYTATAVPRLSHHSASYFRSGRSDP